ncbi:MAG: hypothetical protein KDK91_33885, partial [Gammaproteobacteria bacterium]|nr:hypothetical protein [Gammaproteobacteria bacterium]
GAWVVGLLLLIPYTGYYLLVEAQPGALPMPVIVLLFWVFGFWTVAGPWLFSVGAEHAQACEHSARR